MEEHSRHPLDSPSRLEYVRVKNFRALQEFELADLTPITVFAGPNGSGKSTFFDVLAFLQEAFNTSLQQAVESRFGVREMRTRGQSGSIEIEIHVRFEDSKLCYQIEFDELDGVLVVLQERGTGLEMDGARINQRIITVSEGEGWVWEGGGIQVEINLPGKGELAAPLVGRIGSNVWLIELRKFVSQWFVSSIEPSEIRHIPEAGPQARLSRTADNLTNVLEWLADRDPASLQAIEHRLQRYIPRLEKIGPVPTSDGRSMLQLKDIPFERGIPARFASDGTLKLLAYLTVLQRANSLQLIGFEEPETYMAPQTLFPLAESMRESAGEAQIFITTHSPTILNAFRPPEVWILFRDERGFSKAIRSSTIRGVKEAMNNGAALGNLWFQGFLRVGDPTRNAGMPASGVVEP